MRTQIKELERRKIQRNNSTLMQEDEFQLDNKSKTQMTQRTEQDQMESQQLMTKILSL